MKPVSEYLDSAKTVYQEVVNTVTSFSVSDLVSNLLTNDVFLGLFALSLVGGVVYTLRFLAIKIAKILYRQFTVEVTLKNDTRAFFWILRWIQKNELLRKTRRLRLSMEFTNGKSIWMLSPGEGWHWFVFQKRLIIFHKEVKEAKTREPPETITLRVLGRNKIFIQNIINEAENLSKSDENMKVHQWDGNYWRSLGPRMPRSMDTVFLPSDKKKKLINDIEWFVNNKQWHIDRGIPYRRGYLFYGPPGTGKSSLALAIASYLGKDIYILGVHSVSDKSIQTAFSEVPEGNIILLEDIDTNPITHARSEKLSVACESSSENGSEYEIEDKGYAFLTLSGLLNVLDGVVATENRIVVMTTNKPEGLDKALIRPGRVDFDMKLSSVGHDACLNMYYRFFPDADFEEAKKFATGQNNKTGAEIQQMLIEKSIVSGENVYER